MAGDSNSRGATIYQRASTSEKTIEAPQDSSSQGNFFTVGKIDAGIAVLISDSVHLIEFPSLLLPAGVGPGSIVNISCTRNVQAERRTTDHFWDLQNSIFDLYGDKEPVAPKLRVRNTTQTSVTLEWDKLELAQSKLLGLSIWRNNQRLTTIPNPLNNTSTKLSGLSLDSDYTFHLVLKTSAGTFTSPIVKIHTHTISDTSGISVCFGLVEPAGLLAEAKDALKVMKARGDDRIQIETTHFVATSPASVNNPRGGPGVEYQKALQLSIPVVSPEWVIACAREHKMVPIANYYSVGTTNHAASISSAQLVGPNGQLPPSKPLSQKRTTATISEDQLPAPPTQSEEEEPASPGPLPVEASTRSDLAEEEPDAPPSDARHEVRSTVLQQVGVEGRREVEPEAPPREEEDKVEIESPPQDQEPEAPPKEEEVAISTPAKHIEKVEPPPQIVVEPAAPEKEVEKPVSAPMVLLPEEHAEPIKEVITSHASDTAEEPEDGNDADIDEPEKEVIKEEKKGEKGEDEMEDVGL